MADIALVTAGTVRIVGNPVRQTTLPAGEAIVAGAPVTQNASGKWVNAAAGGVAPLNTVQALATRSAAIGESVTGLKEGHMGGFNLSAQAYGTKLFVSNTSGTLADAAGTASLQVATVEAVGSNQITNPHNKVLAVNIL